MTLDPDVTREMIEAGNDFASQAADANILKTMGCLLWKKDKFKNLDLIEAYLNNEIDSVTGVYVAMERARRNA